ncbi:DEAD/DEAH box helicase [Actinacidiphila sp. DG2A-62]|uniref:DEAD/DEAH box helicase n=1 Tax=Actinacidiphila sp. DG2A-62 TaxID=3108821 RepID=UPI002DB65D15|nr:DEAD/DEAH box helicase [Actinacidiphila sp. DG2A-62]MEC3997060.1 DEAD/DEAH box helicase [Actinacidiphila sp. DG2A-62]
MWHEIADLLVRGPGARLTVGEGPFTGRPVLLDARQAAAADAASSAKVIVPSMILRISAPAGPSRGVPAKLIGWLMTTGPDGVAASPVVWSALGEAEREGCRRRLRRAAVTCPQLEPLARQPDPATALLEPRTVLAVHECAAALTAAGLPVRFDAQVGNAIAVHASVGSPTSAGPGALSLDRLVDFRWRFTMAGQPLTPAELDALAHAVEPLIRLRDQWVLVDPETQARARRPRLDPLPAGQALLAALTGTVSIDGAAVDCVAEGELQAVVGRLHQPETAPARVPAAVATTLRDYQHRGFQWLAARTDLGLGCILGDDMGLGKTLSALVLHAHRQARAERPSLVVCPTTLLAGWVREAAQHTPATHVVRYHGPQRTLADVRPGTLVVTSYGTLRADLEKLAALRWDMLTADEAQFAKNPASATARALRRLDARVTLALTGTPLENNTTDLWALLDLTNRGLFDTIRGFRAAYGKPAEDDPRGPAAQRLRNLVQPFMLRRTKDDPAILPELPSAVIKTQPVPLSPQQTGLYDTVVRRHLDQIETADGIQRRGKVLALISALRHICNHPDQYLHREPAAIATEPDCAARSGKLQALDELVAAIAERDEHALVFTVSARTARLLHHHFERRGHACALITGDVPAAAREQTVDTFQTGRHRLLIATTQSAGYGLTLTRAQHVVMYDLPWNPAKEKQAIDRAHRIGQNRTLHVHRLLAEGTVEDHIDTLLAGRRELAGALVTQGEAALSELSTHDLTALVTLKAPTP